jgi:hypothetical protein
MSTKNLYPLIGDNTEKVPWVVTSNLRPDLAFPSHGQNSFLSATSYPLLKEEQIPLKWLKHNPGFPILLIEPSQLDQDWIYHPYNQTKNHYQLRQNPPAKVEQTLVVLEENATEDEIKSYGSKHFIYRDRDNFELINQHLYPIFNSYFFCFQSSWRPDLIVFQDPSKQKYLKPHIVHALHLGGVIQTQYWQKTPTQVKELWYGTWELFHV